MFRTAPPIDTWVNAVSGNWTTASDWSSGVPSASTNAAITAATSAYTITISGAATSTANSLLLNSANATVLDSGTLSVGALTVSAGTFMLYGGVVESGTISASGSGLLSFGDPDNTFSGITYEGPLNVTSTSSNPYPSLLLDGSTIVTGPGGSGAGTINLVGQDGIGNGIGITVDGSLSGVATIDMTGNVDLVFNHSRVIDNCTVNATTDSVSSDQFNVNGSTVFNESDSTTFGINFVFNQIGAGDTYIGWGGTATLISMGSILAMSSGGTLFIDPFSGAGSDPIFVNDGLLEVSDGDTCFLDNSTWSNGGTILVTSVGTLGGGTLNLGGTFTTAILDTVTHASGALNIDGVYDGTSGLLDNDNATLTVGFDSSLGTIGLGYSTEILDENTGPYSGTISGGTIADSGGGLAILDGTLSGVTYEGVITLSEYGAALTLNDGTEVTGVGGAGQGTINLTGYDANLQVYNALSNVGSISATGDYDSIEFWETRTLDDMTVTFGTGDTASDSITFASDASQATLTLGPQFELIQVGTAAVSFNLENFYTTGNGTDTLINQGLILAEGTFSTNSSYGTFSFGAPFSGSPQGILSNSGTVIATNDDSIYFTLISLTNTGLLSASSGGTLNLVSVSTFANLAAGTLTSGTISLGQAAVLELENNTDIITDSASITLSSYLSEIQSYDSSTGSQVAIEATLQTISAGGTLALLSDRDYVATANSGTFTDAGTLILQGANFGTISNGFTTALDLSGGTISGFGDVCGNLVNSGSSTVAGGAIALEGALSGSGTLSIASGAGLILSSGGSLGGTISDSGSLTLSSTSFTATKLAIGTGGVLAGAGTWSGTITDGGLVDATSGTLSVAGLSVGATLAAGIGLEADAGATLQLANNAGVTADAGSITLSGAASVIDWLNTTSGSLVALDSTLSGIKAGGILSLLAGRNFTAVANSGTFTDAGTLVLGGGIFTATTKLSLSSGAAISGSGTVAGSIASSGAVTWSGGSLTTTGTLSGTGTLSIGSAETAAFTSAGTQSYSGTLIDRGTVVLSGTDFASATLSLTAGSTLSGFGTVAGTITNAGFIDATGGTLSIAKLASSGGTLNAGAVEADASSVLQLAANTTITTLLGTATLSGVGSEIQSLNSGTQVTLDATLATIASGGMLAITNGRSFSVGASGGALTDAGILSIGSGSIFTATNVAVSSTGTLIDDGTYTGGLTNAGQVMILDGNTMMLNSGTTLGGTFTGNGTLSLAASATYTMSPTTLLSLDTLLIAAGATLSGSGTISTAIDGAGTITAQGGTLLLDGNLRGSYTLGVASGSTLQLADGSHFFGSIHGSSSNLTVINADQVSGNSYAASLGGSGTLTLTNSAGAEFYGASTGIIVEAGSSGRTVINNSGAIVGKTTGMSISGTLNTITNSGFIEADNGAAINVVSGPTTINNTGTIVNYLSSGAAVSFAGSSASTLTNAGTIDGGYYLTSGVAVQFSNANNNRLIVDPGATFGGTALGGTGTNTLELAVGSGGTGTLSGLGSNFVGFTATQVDASAAWFLAGTNALSSSNAVSLAAGASLTLQGTLTETGGTITNSGSLVISSSGSFIGTGAITGSTTLLNSGFLEASGGTLSISNNMSGAGSVALGSSATLIDYGTLTTGTLSFLGNSGDLEFSIPGHFSGLIADFNTTDTIDLLSIVATGDTFSNNTLTLTGSSGTIASFVFSGNYNGDSFTLGSDGHGGTLINLT